MVCVKVSGHIPLAVIKISGWTPGRRILHHLGPSVTLVDQTQSVKDTKQFYVGQHSQIFLQMNLHVTASANWIRKQGGVLLQGIFLLKQKVVRIKGMWQRGIPTVWWKGEMPPAMRTAVTPPRTHLTKKKKKKKPKGEEKREELWCIFSSNISQKSRLPTIFAPSCFIKNENKTFPKAEKSSGCRPEITSPRNKIIIIKKKTEERGDEQEAGAIFSNFDRSVGGKGKIYRKKKARNLSLHGEQEKVGHTQEPAHLTRRKRFHPNCRRWDFVPPESPGLLCLGRSKSSKGKLQSGKCFICSVIWFSQADRN